MKAGMRVKKIDLSKPGLRVNGMENAYIMCVERIIKDQEANLWRSF